jgi:gamma-glutamyl-gamma-aminobutyraldehyde dehydrogenase
VLKPSEKSPLTALRLAELAIEAGLPEGVFNVVPGYGHEAGEALALHMDVDAIGFTGSTRVGRKMLEYAGRSNLKRVYNELGGKSAFVVFDDFGDVARAAKTVAGSMFFKPGRELQRAIACVRARAHRRRVRAPGRLRGAGTRPGDPLSGHAPMGAIRRRGPAAQRARPHRCRRSDARRWSAGGEQRDGHTGGYYVSADAVRPRRNACASRARRSSAGAVVIRFAGEAEAVRDGQRQQLRLQASVWSDNVNRAHRVAARAARRDRARQPVRRGRHHRCRSAATSRAATGATSRCTRSTSTPS